MKETETSLKLKFLIALPFGSDSNYQALNGQLAGQSLTDLLRWSLDVFGDKVAQVTSFGPTGMVILDQLAKLSPGIRVITLDTGFLFEETYALWEQVQQRYPIQLDIRRPVLTPEAQAQVFADKLWEKAPDQCCRLHKVIPLSEVLHGLEAWITGLRQDQSPTRAHVPLIGWDEKHRLVKLNPMINWKRSEVWRYIVENNVPYNLLHDQGYASIGCHHCTKRTVNAADERSGRWQGQQKIECGIHI
jgi:phosphoadenosine phosphosulfate reductase